MTWAEIAAFGTAIASLIVAVSGVIKIWYDVRQVHTALNSRLDELVESKRKEGEEKGRKDEVARQDKIASDLPRPPHD